MRGGAFWRPAADGVAVAVKVQAKSHRPGVGGRMRSADGERLRIGVAAPAEGGKANLAACATLARALDVAASAVSVQRGLTSPEKTLHVAGDPVELGARLEAL